MVSPQTEPPPRCLICGQSCRPVLTGLWDDRYGAPGTYDVVQCRSCGLEQTWPQPRESELAALYEKFYNRGGGGETVYTKIRERFLLSSLYRVWLRWDGDVSFHLRRGRGRLLDVGCNEGRGLAIFANNGYQAEGLEINPRAAALARERGFTIHTRPLAQLNTPVPYDVIVLGNVLEHTSDPVSMLKEVRRLLAPKGEVWISCPNAASSWRRLFGRRWAQWHVPFHLSHFSRQTLENALGRAGLRLTEVLTFTPALWLAASFCISFNHPKGRANRLLGSSLAMAGLILAARAFILPWAEPDKQNMTGDCLIAKAAPKTG